MADDGIHPPTIAAGQSAVSAAADPPVDEATASLRVVAAGFAPPDRATTTPPMHSAPPAIASHDGTSARTSQARTMTIGATRYVVDPRRPAASPAQREGPRRERDRRREEAEVEEPADARDLRGAQLVDEPGRERQAGDHPGDARQPRDGEGRRRAEGGLLERHAGGVGERGPKAQDDPERRVAAAGRRRRAGERDHRRPAERDREPQQQALREALAEEQPGEEGDEDRAGVDEHRRGARVEIPLGLVQRDVVHGEPEQARGDDQRQVAARRPAQPADQDDDAQRDRPDGQPPQGQRPGREVVDDRPDPDERRRPERHGHERGRHREPIESGIRLGHVTPPVCGRAAAPVVVDNTDWARRGFIASREPPSR